MSYLANEYKSGSSKAICDRCGCIFKREELMKTWDGLMTCKDDFEYRPEQDHIRGFKPETALPWTRPEATDTFRTDRTFTAVSENTIPSGSSGTRGGL